MPHKPDYPLYVYYDGTCAVCAREIDHYRQMDRENRLIAKNIAAEDFDVGNTAFSREEFLYQLHAIDSSGRVYRGVDAFWAIWQAFPASSLYSLLGTVVMLPLVNPLARLCYRGFARIRRYLPQRRDTCADNSCRNDRR